MGWSYTSNGGIVFDLDDPRFTSPMSVISGLASGYCERKAAVDLAYASASWTTDAVKSDTVSRLAANIAINHSIGTVSAYDAGFEIFQAPQSWAVGTPPQTKTFMDYFDHDLASLANNYVTRWGAAYNGFSGLAVAASARASSDVAVSNYTGYTVGTTATSGGIGGVAGTSEYTGTFVPMFAAGWAVERRDMLEELRYTSVATIDSYYYCRENQVNFSFATSNNLLSLNDVVHSGVAGGNPQSSGINMNLSIQTRLRYERLDSVTAITLNDDPISTWAASSSIPAGNVSITYKNGNVTSTTQVPAAYLNAYYTSVYAGVVKSGCYRATHINTSGTMPSEVGLFIADSITGVYPISVFVGKPYYFGTVPHFSDCYAASDTVIARIDTAYGGAGEETLPNYGHLVIATGATVTVTDSWLATVVVEPGGKLVLSCVNSSFDDGPRIGDCCLLSSGGLCGSIEGLFTDINHPGTGRYMPLVESMFLNFDTLADYTAMTRDTLLSGTTTVSQIDDYYYSAAVVVAGATVTFQNMINKTMRSLYIQSGGTAIIENTDDSDVYVVSGCWVEPGGTLLVHQLYRSSNGEVTSSLRIENLTVCNSGICTFDGNGMTQVPYATVLSGGTLNITDLVCLGLGATYPYMDIEDGAVVTLFDGAVEKTTLMDIYNYHGSDTLPVTTEVRRFNSLGMVTADNATPVSHGWNVVNASFAPTSEGSTSSYATLFVSAGAFVVNNPESLYWAPRDSSLIHDGFEIVTYKGFRDPNTTDHYPKFVYRKFGDDHK